MNITFIHHSCFLVETERSYYLFDYYKGQLPPMNTVKPVFVLSSHGHSDHYSPEVFRLLAASGMQQIRAVLSEDIAPPANIDVLSVSPRKKYELGPDQNLTTFRSTDLGVAFLIEDHGVLIYHAGDLNDWVWDGEPDGYNRQMTLDYREQIQLLANELHGRQVDGAFVVLDPRQERDYDRGMCYFLENISAKSVYPMHYWDRPEIIDTFIKDHPEYMAKIQNTQRFAQKRGNV